MGIKNIKRLVCAWKREVTNMTTQEIERMEELLGLDELTDEQAEELEQLEEKAYSS